MSNSLKQKPFKSAVADHLTQHSLDEHQLEALEQLTRSSENVRITKTSGKTPRKMKHIGYTIAASLVLMIGALITYQSTTTSQGIPEQIAHEVAKNHLRMKPLDINSQNPEEVRAYFTLLDFLPIASTVYGQKNANILGGRYCSVKGVTAAQLRFENRQGKMETLYQVPYDANLFSDLPKLEAGDAPLKLFKRGLEINMWVEKGLLMVTTQPSQ